jgi:hypothetical protein
VSGRISLSAGEVVVGCVTENTPKFLGQALRLLQSIRWFGGELAKSPVVVGVVEQLDPRARRSLEAYGADIRIVPRFHRANPMANRLQLFAELSDRPEAHYLILDSDTLVARDPLPLLKRDVFQAKIAPFPTVTHDVFERLFAHFGVPLPPRNYTTGYSGTPTIPYFNAGVISIPRALADKLAPEWRRFNTALADEPSLAAPCEKHMHQAALALALAASKIPAEAVGAELNYQLNATEYPTPRGYADVDPVILHYHDRVDREGRLLRVPFPKAQERIDRFHERLAEENARGIAMPLREETGASEASRQIAVIGMHRSGTSLVVQLLAVMGAYAGKPDDLSPPDVFNPRGYWELLDAITLNDDILGAAGANWREPAEADLTRLTEAQQRRFVARASEITRNLDAHGTWVVKEPRMTLVFPIWREVLERPLCILAWREPAAVARSLMHRDGLPFVIGLALWEEYTRAMLAHTIGLPRILVAYEDLIRDPAGCATELSRATGLHAPEESELRELVDPSLDHNDGDDEGLLNRNQARLRDALRDRSALEWTAVPPVHPETRNLLASFWAEERENAPLWKKTRDLGMLLDSVFASRSWRLGFGITRLWRAVSRTKEETAVERWKKMR